MAQPLPKPATYEDLRALPENLIGELIGGELIALPRPSSRHAIAATVLGGELTGPFHRGKGGPGGWWFVFEPELHLGGDVLVPDLAGWRHSTMAVPPDAPFFSIAPDWVCEVLSPSTAALDRVRKLPIYLRERVGHAWLVDPLGMTLEVFRREGDKWVVAQTFAGAESVRAEPFTEAELELGALWLPESKP